MKNIIFGLFIITSSIITAQANPNCEVYVLNHTTSLSEEASEELNQFVLDTLIAKKYEPFMATRVPDTSEDSFYEFSDISLGEVEFEDKIGVKEKYKLFSLSTTNNLTSVNLDKKIVPIILSCDSKCLLESYKENIKKVIQPMVDCK